MATGAVLRAPVRAYIALNVLKEEPSEAAPNVLTRVLEGWFGPEGFPVGPAQPGADRADGGGCVGDRAGGAGSKNPTNAHPRYTLIRTKPISPGQANRLTIAHKPSVQLSFAISH